MRQNQCQPRLLVIGNTHRRQLAARIMIILYGDADLFQIVRALSASGRFAGGLNGGQQQSDQNPDDRDDNQQFHKGETI